MPDFDVGIIGAGPGGYVAAIRAAQLGARVVLVERAELGGVCLNWGCLPTKALLHAAGLYQKIKHANEFGLKVDKAGFDMGAMVARKNDVVAANKKSVAGLLAAHKIEVVKAEASIPAPGRILLANQEELNAKAIIVATGARPAQLPGLTPDGHRVLTSTEALDLVELPKRVAIIGAGAIGAEFACLWNALEVEVTLIEIAKDILPLADHDLSRRLRSSLRKRGVDVRTGTAVRDASVGDQGVALELEGKKGGTVEVDKVLLSVGSIPNATVGGDNQDLGVALGAKGEILVNERMETSVKGIFAIGDVVGKTMLAHGASAEGVVAAQNAVGGNASIDYRVVPSCTFTSPEVASVGLTERQACDADIDVKTGKFSFAATGRAQTMGETEGQVKIVGDATTDEVLGIHIMGAEAGELVASAAMAMTMEATVEEIAHTIHTHPTLAEAIKEAAEDYFGIGIHTPPAKPR